MKRLFALFALMLGLLAVTSPLEARTCVGSMVSDSGARDAGSEQASGVEAKLQALSPSQRVSRRSEALGQPRQNSVRTVILPAVMLSDCPRE